MVSGDHYATYAQVQYALMNAGIGASGNTLYDDNALETALDFTMAAIHNYIYDGQDSTTKLTGNHAVVLATIQVDLVFMMVLRSVHARDNNLANGGEIISYFQTVPAFTFQHLQAMDKIKNNLADQVAYNFSTRNGNEVI